VAVNGLVTAIREALRSAADPAKAPEMQRYMKSEMPFLGVQKPSRTATTRAVFKAYPLTSRDSWIATALELWREATHREERYAALDLMRRHPEWQRPDLLPLYDEFVVTGAWWDYVDDIASHHIGHLLRAYPADVTPVMRSWTTNPDRWRRRTSVICQLASKDATDLSLLRDAIEANVDDPDFFLRKGIGWALRQHARTAPDWVREFVTTHPGLSPLSRREALKHLQS
jgi:3-methyladenine DNA glycosylase AlkD